MRLEEVRIGALLMPTDEWNESVATVRWLERLGYHHVWVYDHLSWQRYRDRPWHATYPWLAGLAASTERIRLGTMVSNPNIRHPVHLAKEAMTIDRISGGRLTIGLGAGGTGFDATVLGQEPLTPGQRLDRLTELTHCLDGLLTGELRNHEGPWFRFDEARMLPGCVQRPRLPLALAAGGPRSLDLVARRADAWITYGDPTRTDVTEAGTERIVAEQAAELDRRCRELGRDPRTIDRIYLVGNTEARPLASIEAFGRFVERYAELGFTDVVFHLPRTDDPVWNDDLGIVEEIAAAHLARPDPS